MKRTATTLDKQTYRLQGNGLMIGPNHFAVRNEIFFVLRELFRVTTGVVDTRTYSGRIFRTTHKATRNVIGGIDIGCKKFNRQQTRNLAEWAGLGEGELRRYFPNTSKGTTKKARAAAAGR